MQGKAVSKDSEGPVHAWKKEQKIEISNALNLDNTTTKKHMKRKRNEAKYACD